MARVKFANIIEGLLPQKKIPIDKRTLRSEGIGALIQDERWIRLFSTIKKTPSIIKAEQTLRSYLDEKTRLHMENNMIQAEKNAKINKITELTNTSANNGSESFRMDIDACETRIREIDERAPLILQRQDELDIEINRRNLELLEDAASYLYQYMKNAKRQVAGLDDKISDTRQKLKDMIDERETLDASANETYNFLHGLLGAKQIETLDDHYTIEK